MQWHQKNIPINMKIQMDMQTMNPMVQIIINNQIIITVRTDNMMINRTLIPMIIIIMINIINIQQKINNYECRTGPFEGFFVSSVEFCKHGKFNDRKDNGYDDSDKNLQIFPANKVAELGDRWWQWIVSLNNVTDPNPFTETGQAGCDVGLQDDGRLLFLVGSPSDPPLSGTFPVHDCKIKEGTSILFPVVNVFCAAFETNPPQNESQTRKCANEAQDTAFDLQLEIDGKEIQNLERQYRVDSPPGGFEFTAVPGNPATALLGSSIGVSDGVWILLKHLPPGEHTITFSGKFDFTGLIPEKERLL